VSETSERREKALECFSKGYNCAQSVVLAFSDLLPIDAINAAKLASPFGGGMGRMREVCGSVSGMYMVLGFLQGYSDPKDPGARPELYSAVRSLAEEFRSKHGSILCRELTSPPLAKAHSCSTLVGDAAEMLEKLLAKE